ncbi:hypothetical protein A9G13_05620 [Gilliamella sp. wkB178]|uniref:glycosyltransferase family 9 protein n=1 Tax=Gilliamella sp. wkB178 TaxID=3120259 RepID=UPI00080D9407|nr:glycosyltransferase family 9 protein [Gilliamella apicola]OCG07693.1 hypothetical protein A9G13_05620 [Gilliamella apicola]
MINKLLRFIKYLNRQRNLKVKPLKIAIKLALLNHKKKIRTVLSPEKYKTVAILMNDQGIGDAIVTSYLIRTLRDKGYTVYVIVEKRIAFLFDEFIRVDGTFLYDKKKNIKYLSKQLDNLKIDVAIDLVDKGDNSVRRSQILSTIKPIHTIGFNQEQYKLYDTSIPYFEYSSHISVRSIKVLDIMKIKTDVVKYYVNIPKEIEMSVQDFINKEIGNDKKIIIFNPYGSNEARSFSDAQIDTILFFLSQYKNYLTMVVGEQNKIGRLKVNDKQNILINPFSSFFSTVALIKLSAFVITVDTSIVHIASIYNKKMACVYNNRIIDNKFINNLVWGPNYSNAVQLFTNDNLGTGLGDQIANLDPNIILQHLKSNLEKLSTN